MRIGILVVVVVAFGSRPARAQGNPKILALQGECDGQSGRACLELARVFRNGRENQTRDANKAAGFYQKACQFENPEACQEWGESMLGGADGLAGDTARVLWALETGCRLEPEGKSGKVLGLAGGRRRCAALIELYQRLPRATIDDSVAIRTRRLEHATRACERGKVKEACALKNAWLTYPDSSSTRWKAVLAERDSLARARTDSIDKARADSIQSRHVADSIARRPAVDSTRINKRASSGEGKDLKVVREQLNRDIADCNAGLASACAAAAKALRTSPKPIGDRAKAGVLQEKACKLDKKFCSSTRKP